MADEVLVPEVAAITVSRKKAIRIWIGRFIVDYVETFVALIPAVALSLVLTPQLRFSSLEEAKLAAMAWIIQLVGPAISALVSAGRRALMVAWPAVKAWLQNGGG